MSISILEEPIEGVYIIKNHIFTDDRGTYEKHFDANFMAKKSINFTFDESSDLYTGKGSIRGIHYQTGRGQDKLVRVIKGKIFDVIVDMRNTSSNYLKHYSITIDEKDGISMYIPSYYAHGFMALEEGTIFSYHCSGIYEPEKCGGLRWNDPKLGIEWPIKKYGIKKVIVTQKDSSWSLL